MFGFVLFGWLAIVNALSSEANKIPDQLKIYQSGPRLDLPASIDNLHARCNIHAVVLLGTTSIHNDSIILRGTGTRKFRDLLCL